MPAMSTDDLALALDGELIAAGVIRICKRLPLSCEADDTGVSLSRSGDRSYTVDKNTVGAPRTARSVESQSRHKTENNTVGAPPSARLPSDQSRPGECSYRLGNLQALREPPRLPGEPAGGHRRRVYIDTETTGLSGGSGTLAFLVGMAVVEADAIVMTQFLMTRFAAESDLLAAFANTLSTDDQLVSYNGKSYDLPLLMTRFRMQGLAHPFDGLPHLDLLYPVRRLFSRRWSDCRLTSLEANLLGFTRIDDLPGSEAPAAWFDYIRRGQGAQLVKVVDHNRQDIVSLAVAHSALAQAIEQPRAFEVDLYTLARWLAETREADARALLESHADELCCDGQRLLARLARRAGHWPQAVALWESLAASGCTDSLERLAKYHEHISKDLAAAQRCCTLLPGNPAHDHRRRRINAKLNL